MQNVFVRIVGGGMFLLFTIGTFFMGYSQIPQNDEDIDSLVNSILFYDSIQIENLLALHKKYDYVYTTVNYNSNSYLAGRSLDISQYTISPQLSYFHHKGYSFSVAGLVYQSYEPHWNNTNVSLGYFSYLGKNDFWYVYSGYSRYFYSDGSTLLTNSIDMSVGVKSKQNKLGAKISSNYIFGGDTYLFQCSAKTYWNAVLYKNKKLALVLRPQFLLFISDKSMIINDVVYENSYGILNNQINIPLRLLTNTFDFEFAYTMNIPKEIESEQNLPLTHLLSFSIGYINEIPRKSKNK